MTLPSRLGLLAAVLLGLQACAVYTTPESQPPVVERVPAPAPRAPSPPRAEPAPPVVRRDAVPPAPSSPAVLALLDRADQHYAVRDLDAAAASLERALHIEPRNPRLWHRLAAVRLDQGQFDQAVQMAAKSNSLAGYDRGLQARNWRLIANARYATGDTEGARAAEARAEALQ